MGNWGIGEFRFTYMGRIVCSLIARRAAHWALALRDDGIGESRSYKIQGADEVGFELHLG